jgi:hypothetical protein
MGGERERARPQAVDALHVGLEGERHELGVVGVAGDLEDEVVADGAGAHLAVAGRLDERADERGDEQPGALVDGLGVGAQRGRGGCGRAQAAGRGADRDDHRLLVARALLRELANAAPQLRVEQDAQAGGAGAVLECRGQIFHLSRR